MEVFMARSYKKQAIKAIKKTHGLTIFLVLLFFAAATLGGFFAYRYVTKNDTFELVGEKDITLSVGDTFTDAGYKVSAFGKDISSKVEVAGEVDTTKEGVYVLTYTVNHIKYKDVKKCRVITVVEV